MHKTQLQFGSFPLLQNRMWSNMCVFTIGWVNCYLIVSNGRVDILASHSTSSEAIQCLLCTIRKGQIQWPEWIQNFPGRLWWYHHVVQSIWFFQPKANHAGSQHCPPSTWQGFVSKCNFASDWVSRRCFRTRRPCQCFRLPCSIHSPVLTRWVEACVLRSLPDSVRKIRSLVSTFDACVLAFLCPSSNRTQSTRQLHAKNNDASV